MSELWEIRNPDHSAVLFIDDYRLVKHLGEGPKGAGNLVGHQLHDSGAVGQHHVEVSLDFYILGFLSMEPIFHTWFSINSLTWLIFPWRAARTSGVSPLMFRESTSTWFFTQPLYVSKTSPYAYVMLMFQRSKGFTLCSNNTFTHSRVSWISESIHHQ